MRRMPRQHDIGIEKPEASHIDAVALMHKSSDSTKTGPDLVSKTEGPGPVYRGAGTARPGREDARRCF